MKNKQQGVYEIEFSTSSGIRNLVSGIYFYQLKAGSFHRNEENDPPKINFRRTGFTQIIISIKNYS